MARIFISYKRDDKDVVFKIKDDIEKHIGKDSCWVDFKGIESDAYFVDFIVSAINQADVFLFMYSKRHSEIIDIKKDWTVRELNFAEKKEKKIVFINLDNSKLTDYFEMMYGLKQQVYVDSKDAMNNLYVDLRKWLSIESDVKIVDNLESRNEAVYKIRVNRACWLYLDEEKIQQLEANKIAKISLPEGEYLRKVVAIDDESICDEKELVLFGSSKVETIVLNSSEVNKVVKPEKTESKKIEPEKIEDKLEKHHEYVDLGLSVKWATYNVGANKPEECGDYFAWGEVKSKKEYSLNTYKYYEGTIHSLSKNNKIVLDVDDDAARVNWGGEWRMPTEKEFKELRKNCKWIWTSQNGMRGYKVVGNNGNFIFLPAAGFMQDKSLQDNLFVGGYWSRSLDKVKSSGLAAFGLSFRYSNSKVDVCSVYRFNGYSIRPVCP